MRNQVITAAVIKLAVFCLALTDVSEMVSASTIDLMMDAVRIFVNAVINSALL